MKRNPFSPLRDVKSSWVARAENGFLRLAGRLTKRLRHSIISLNDLYRADQGPERRSDAHRRSWEVGVGCSPWEELAGFQESGCGSRPRMAADGAPSATRAERAWLHSQPDLVWQALFTLEVK